jgi:hypothetical protein
MPNACSPMYKNTSTAPIKPDAKPIGTPIDISNNNPTISIIENKEAKEQENKYIKLKKIIEKFDTKTILARINQNTPITEYKIMAIQFRDNGKIELHLEEEYSKERSITLFNDINILENFLEKARENYYTYHYSYLLC